MAEPTSPLFEPEPPSRPGGEPQAAAPDFEILIERRPPGLLHRLLTTHRHLLGLLFGSLNATVRQRPPKRRRGLQYRALWLTAKLSHPFLDRSLRHLSFPVQLRRRLEILGVTYIKLGQILSLREDLLPTSITDELKNLLDRLPVVPFPRYLELVAQALPVPVDQAFSWIEPRPLGSASIAQTHRATTMEGDAVILKLVKPGIRELLIRDARLLRFVGSLLQLFLPRLRPKRIIDEFVDYTLKELDLSREADNAETFAANFKDMPDVIFPRVYRRYSSRNLLCMQFLDGFKPSDPRAAVLSEEEKDQLIDLGAAAIIRMLYKDGFFHADLHPGNLLILSDTRVGFIDLGMVGRLDDELRRTLLYYFYCLVTGDAENAARYLASVAEAAPGANPTGFRREVAEVCRRWQRKPSFEGFSLAMLIMESVGKGVEFGMYFPVEMVLMVKALVTYEGVGQLLKPGFDVAAISQSHVNGIFLHQFNPVRLIRESLRGAPEMVDALVKAPLLITEGLRVLEQSTQKPPENPFSGLRGSLLAGFCLIGGAIVVSFGGPWPLWAGLFLLAVILALFPGG